METVDAGAPRGPGERPDAGQCQDLARRCAREAAGLIRGYWSRRPTAQEYEQVEHLLKRAVEYTAEVRGFVPDGAEAVPAEALWTAEGQRAWRERPEDFRVPRIDRELARHRLARAEFAAVFGPPPAERSAAAEPPLARSAYDASMFLDFRKCRCGGRLISVAERTDDRGVLTVKARCARRRWHRYHFRFTTVPGTPEAPHWEMSDRRQPSHLVDPGEWLVAARSFAGGNPRMRAMNMKLAASSVEEAMLFVPPGQDAVPAGAVRSRPGRELYEAEPDRFRWSSLLAERDDYLAASGPEDPLPAVHPLPARSVNEALLFIDLHRCACGTIEFRRSVHESEAGLRYGGMCLTCRRDRAFVFTVPPGDSDPEPMGYGFSLPGDGPSALLDAGEFWTAGETYEQEADRIPPRDRDDDSWERRLAALASSVAVCDELLALLAPDDIPDEHFRTPTGRALRRRHPELFTRTHLSTERDRRRRLLDAFLAE